MVKMTVQQGLNELKLLEDRISKKTGSLNAYFLLEDDGKEIYKKSKKSDTVESVNAEASSNLQSVLDLINLKTKIKQAIVLSNATTKLTVAGKEYTVAEAIEHRNETSHHLYSLFAKLSRQYTDVVLKKDAVNDGIQSELDKKIEKLLSAEDKNSDNYLVIYETLSKKSEKDKVSVNEFTVTYNGKKVKSTDLFNVMEEDYNAFLAEVDYALTASNVKTEIEIED